MYSLFVETGAMMDAPVSLLLVVSSGIFVFADSELLLLPRTLRFFDCFCTYAGVQDVSIYIIHSYLHCSTAVVNKNRSCTCVLFCADQWSDEMTICFSQGFSLHILETSSALSHHSARRGTRC